jgi:hypothetical protein
MSTIRELIEAGERVSAHHARRVPTCSHYAWLDLQALAERLGPDFDIMMLPPACCAAPPAALAGRMSRSASRRPTATPWQMPGRLAPVTGVEVEQEAP